MEQKNHLKVDIHYPKKPPEQPQYKEKYNKIQDVVQGLNEKLTDLFQKKQKQLIDQYANEMIKVKQQLNQLKTYSNQDQIRKKFNKKKEELELQREKYLQSSIFFCNKCQIFKQKLSKSIHEARDLENQIKFLTNQIKQANTQNPIHKSVQKYNYTDLTNSKKYIKSYGTSINGLKKNYTPSQYQSDSITESKIKKDAEVNLMTQKSLIRRNQSYRNNQKFKIAKKNLDLKIKAALQNNTFKQTQFEKMFMDSVLKVKEKKKQKKIQEKNNSKTTPKSKLQTHDIKIYDGQLNDFDKKNIIQHFLSKDEVKRYLYQLIFIDLEELQQVKDKRKGNWVEVLAKNFI